MVLLHTVSQGSGCPGGAKCKNRILSTLSMYPTELKALQLVVEEVCDNEMEPDEEMSMTGPHLMEQMIKDRTESGGSDEKPNRPR